EYALINLDTPQEFGRQLILAKELVEPTLEELGIQGQVIATTSGKGLEFIGFRHPLATADAGYNRVSPVYCGEYVILDTGTGVVHSAPAYGVEHFVSCKEHALDDADILNPVQANGVYADSLPLFGGQFIWKANPEIVQALQGVGTLLKAEDTEHSYMHCWRHKTPVIY